MRQLPEATSGVTVRLRSGSFPVVNTVMSAVFVPVFAALVVLAAAFERQDDTNGDRAWTAFALLAAVIALLVSARWLAISVTGLRAVVVVTGPDGTVSVPRLTVRRGFHREVLPLAGVSAHLDNGGGVRNKRWQLIIRRRGHDEVHCDSVTSSRGVGADTRDTPAGRAARWLTEQGRTARDASGLSR